MKIKNKVVLWQDVVVVLALVIYMGTGFLTIYVLAELEVVTEFAENIESNPIAREVYVMGFYLMIFQWVEVAFLGGFYYILRWATLNKMQPDSGYMLLSFFTIFIALFYLQNFLNDLPFALKILGGD